MPAALETHAAHVLLGARRGRNVAYFFPMNVNLNTYISGSTCVHAFDARAKIVLLVTYSVTLFLVETWWALGVCALLFVLLLALAKIGPGRVLGLSIPILVIALVAIAANSFSFDASAAQGTGSSGGVSAGLLADVLPVVLAGSFGFVPAGFARGCFYAVRIVLLVAASLAVSLTTSSTSLTEAFSSFLSPLRALRVPVDDIASVLSIALRFIPLVAEELGRIHDAQWSRGAKFGEGGLVVRLRAWTTVLVPLFVAMFRRADNLAIAMDARCYGCPGVRRTSLSRRKLSAKNAFAMLGGIVFLAVLAVLG